MASLKREERPHHAAAALSMPVMPYRPGCFLFHRRILGSFINGTLKYYLFEMIKKFPHIGKPCSEKFAVFFSCFLIISQRSEEIYERSYRVARAFFLLEFSPHSRVIGYSKDTEFLIISPLGIYSFCIYILCQELNR